jgi:O-succinylbenzoic acid--CoA ligase
MNTHSIINWESNETNVLFNPRLPNPLLDKIEGANLPELPGHVWIATSGTSSTDTCKLVALSKEALLTSAEAANKHLQVTEKDIWLNILPTFHVGGLGIFARAYLSKSSVVSPENWSWDVENFCSIISKEQITLTSLVPAQVYDLVVKQKVSPKHLRGIVVGGGELAEKTYSEARALGWPILPSYGLTECCSQVGTSTLESLKNTTYPPITPLSHVELRISPEGLIEIKSNSLLTGVAVLNNNLEYFDPKIDGWYQTEDLGEVSKTFIKHLGRKGDLKKVGGELVNIAQLNSILKNLGHETSACFLFSPSERLENQVELVLSEELRQKEPLLLSKLQELIPPYARPRVIHYLQEIPLTDLGKIKSAELAQKISINR